VSGEGRSGLQAFNISRAGIKVPGKIRPDVQVSGARSGAWYKEA